MNVLSLFAGIGGLELGLERAGMTTVGQVEKDPYCRRVLAKHWPEVPRHDDVRTTVDWWRSEPRPAVRVVAGGVPCQPASLAGKGLAQEDERWLWPAYIDVVRALRPDYALMENVPGLFRRGFDDVLGSLAEIGYDAEWDCVPAAAVGAPHLRDRVFIVAYPNDGGLEKHPKRDSRPQAGIESPLRDDALRLRHPVADSARDRWGQGRSGRSAGNGQDGQGLAAQELADADRERRHGRPRIFGQGWRGQPAHRSWWATEPDVGRVAHGIPNRVDRLRALGNAVVPQVAEHIGRLIIAADQREQVAA